jgi:hypothetical protein
MLSIPKTQIFCRRGFLAADWRGLVFSYQENRGAATRRVTAPPLNLNLQKESLDSEKRQKKERAPYEH